MKWLLPLFLVCAAGAGIWYLLRDEADRGYAPAEIRGGREDPTGIERETAMRAEGGQRLGVVGKAPLPADGATTEDWMHGPITWPAGGRVTGKVLAEALAERVPVRFVNATEMDAFLAHEFLDGVPDGEGDLGMLPAILSGSGYVIETQARYVLLRKVHASEQAPEDDG